MVEFERSRTALLRLADCQAKAESAQAMTACQTRFRGEMLTR